MGNNKPFCLSAGRLFLMNFHVYITFGHVKSPFLWLTIPYFYRKGVTADERKGGEMVMIGSEQHKNERHEKGGFDL